jgi:sortase A
MPIYLGASNENLLKGACVISNTSMPIGGENTNCVLAGHRSMYSATMFRHLDMVQVGDSVLITNLWERLVYTVVQIRIIEPSDVGEILIQEGRDLLTLITCHPYGGGGRQRLMVLCERVDNNDAS